MNDTITIKRGDQVVVDGKHHARVVVVSQRFGVAAIELPGDTDTYNVKLERLVLV